ncbi:vinculin-like isoform X3 [Eriocheir sinensis]|uniref:vinculin-like isoform X3 n=1 Tax=Eriocheir sinensis TaxID=95602 RepID=UPI0021C9E7B4|nr:vinculin-like isoform X3 [Eriocheir sinensis]
MPVFHTRTIEGILEPVAQQVSRLVILHEEAEDGNAMPDLEKPVMAVSKAVVNLVKVGRETINSSDDPILKQDMPAALHRVESAAKLLEEASSLLKADPYSQPARKKLIEGARGILQGTSALLLCFDESEVRKIIRECKKVLDYLAVAEVIETMEDLVQFVKDLSPCLTRVSRDVDARQQELTHQVHREILMRCLEGVKTLSPILICSMKIFIQIFHQGGKGIAEAAENRNYLTGRMTDEINEIIRVLQLTTYDEEEWDADNLTVMKKALNAIDGKAQAAHDWLQDPTALRGGIGEKSLRQILAQADRVADRSLPPDREAIRKLSGDISSMTDALCELRQDGKGTTPQGQSLARSIGEKLNELSGAISRAVNNVERSGVQQPAHTVAGRLEQAQRWLNNPSMDDKGLGQQAIGLIVEEGKKVASGLTGPAKTGILALCEEVDSLSQQLSEMCRRGQGDTPQAQAVARALSAKLKELKDKIQTAVVDRVVEDFVDITTPLKQFTDAALAPEGTPGREQNFENRANNLANFSNRAAKTALMVAAGSSGGNKKLTEALLSSAGQVESLTPQLVAAGRIRMTYPTNKAADEHFENLRRQYAESIQKVRDLADEATDSAAFIKASEDLIKRHTAACEASIKNHEPQAMVDNTSAIARLANRVLMVAKQEADNSEDPSFVAKVNAASDQVQVAVTPMVQNAKDVAMNPDDQRAISRWRQSNQAVLQPGVALEHTQKGRQPVMSLLSAVGEVRRAVMVYPDEPVIPPPPDMSSLSLNAAPPRPPAPPQIDLDDDIFKVDFMKIFGEPERALTPSQYQGIHLPERDLGPSNGHTLPGPPHPVVYSDLVSGEVGAGPSPCHDLDRPHSFQSPNAGLISAVPKWGRGEPSETHYDSYTDDELPTDPFPCYRDQAPPRPPLPGGDKAPPPRPPPPETDDEEETSMFNEAPQPNQPIMMAAHGLHQEVKQWSSRDNEIIAAAKKMALLMAQLSQLVRGEGGTKKDLIACAKSIAEASEEVTRLAKDLARECTDKRMRTNLLQVCERIPTIGTQLKILSTVKATMLGAQEILIGSSSEEDQEATEMLVGNAQNLMQSVKETVRAAEAASIKIRTDAGIRLRWVRKQPWYQY